MVTKMLVQIGNAWSDENGKSLGGKKGNQNGKELRIMDWYNGKWEYVLRPTTFKLADSIATVMEEACNNMNIGYSQGEDRTSLYALAKKNKWNIRKINTPCACDCSSLVAVCLNASGIPVSKDMYTGNELAIIKATGEFITLTEKMYLAKSDYLKRGDILLKKGHTAIVLNDGMTRQSYFARYCGRSGSIVDALNFIGENSSYSNRKKIASANNIKLYVGTASQNTKMLNLLKQGILVKP